MGDHQQRIDRNAWKEILAMENSQGEAFLKELIQIFFDIAPDQIKDIQESFADSQLKIVTSLAHNLKSSCGNLGLSKLFQTCGQLEAAAGARNTAQTQKVITELTQDFEVTRREIEQALKSGIGKFIAE